MSNSRACVQLAEYQNKSKHKWLKKRIRENVITTEDLTISLQKLIDEHEMKNGKQRKHM